MSEIQKVLNLIRRGGTEVFKKFWNSKSSELSEGGGSSLIGNFSHIFRFFFSDVSPKFTGGTSWGPSKMVGEGAEENSSWLWRWPPSRTEQTLLEFTTASSILLVSAIMFFAFPWPCLNLALTLTWPYVGLSFTLPRPCLTLDLNLPNQI